MWEIAILAGAYVTVNDKVQRRRGREKGKILGRQARNLKVRSLGEITFVYVRGTCNELESKIFKGSGMGSGRYRLMTSGGL